MSSYDAAMARHLTCFFDKLKHLKTKILIILCFTNNIYN